MTTLNRTLIMFAFLLTTGCSVFGIRTAEELKYTVVEEQEHFEIRTYQKYISAEATMAGDQRAVRSDLFRLLAGYIFGKNTTDTKIAMTAPVLMNPESAEGTQTSDTAPNGESTTSEKIAMTAPVTMEPGPDGQWKMGFSMPAEFTMDTLPRPLDSRVKLVEIPDRTVAVARFSGFFGNDEARAEKAQTLLAWLKKQNKYRVVGTPFYAGYDPPFTLPFLRRNEVLVEVESL